MNEFQLGQVYRVEGVQAVYCGGTNRRDFFLSRDNQGRLSEHVKSDDGVKTIPHSPGDDFYTILKEALEKLE